MTTANVPFLLMGQQVGRSFLGLAGLRWTHLGPAGIQVSSHPGPRLAEQYSLSHALVTVEAEAQEGRDF